MHNHTLRDGSEKKPCRQRKRCEEAEEEEDDEKGNAAGHTYDFFGAMLPVRNSNKNWWER